MCSIGSGQVVRPILDIGFILAVFESQLNRVGRQVILIQTPRSTGLLVFELEQFLIGGAQ